MSIDIFKIAPTFYGITMVPESSWREYGYALLTIAGSDGEVSEPELEWLTVDCAKSVGVGDDIIADWEEYDFEEGDVALFRIGSATAEPTMNLRLPEHEFVLLAHDGIPLPEPVETDVITVGGAARKEFLVRFDKPGTYVMTRDAWPAGFTSADICQAVIGAPVHFLREFTLTVPEHETWQNAVPASHIYIY